MLNKFNRNNENSNDDDFVVIKRILDGDTRAFQILQKKYKRIVSSLIRRMIHNEDDVDDLTQETFIKAYSALSSFQFGYTFSSWIYRIASNNCIDFLRKKRFATISLSQPLEGSDDDQFFEIKDISYQPDRRYMAEENRKYLMEAIENLPENYKDIIKLRHEQDMDYKEISEKLNIPLGTVKAHLFRARKLILNDLKKSIGFPGID